MKPGKLDLPTIWRGCDWPPVILNWKDNNGDPFDLTGWQARAFTRSKYNLNATILNAALGRTKMWLPKGETSGFTLGVQQWDWIWENIDDPRGPYRYPPFLSGSVTIKDPITATPIPIGIKPIPIPGNDDFENATVLPGLIGSISGTTYGATTEEGEPPGDNSVWYMWRSSTAVVIYFSLNESTSRFSIYTGSALPSLHHVVDSVGSPPHNSFLITPGTWYRIRVYKNTAPAAFVLTWTWTI